MQALRCRTLSNASCCIIMGAMTGTEPTTKIAGSVTKWYTSQMRANAYHDQEILISRHCPVCIGGQVISGYVGISGDGIRKGKHIFRTGLRDFRVGPVPDEHRLAEKTDSQLRSGFHTGDIDADLGQRADIGGWVHLIEQWPDRSPYGNRARSGGGVVQEIPAELWCLCIHSDSRSQLPVGEGQW